MAPVVSFAHLPRPTYFRLNQLVAFCHKFLGASVATSGAADVTTGATGVSMAGFFAARLRAAFSLAGPFGFGVAWLLVHAATAALTDAGDLALVRDVCFGVDFGFGFGCAT